MTNQQKQCLLYYLGYYTGAIDGILGPASTQATRGFQADYGLDADGILGPLTEAKLLEAITGKAQKVDFWDSIKHFRKEEFRCKCGKYCDGYPAEMDRQVVRAADKVREHFGEQAHVSSGLRCRQHNADVGGVADSRHLTGKAIDLGVEGVSAEELLARAVTQSGIRYAYAIDEIYIHMDVS